MYKAGLVLALYLILFGIAWLDVMHKERKNAKKDQKKKNRK